MLLIFFSSSIACARIYVERAIQRIKLCIILNRIPASLRPFSNTTWKAWCGLTNLMSPIMKDILDYEEDFWYNDFYLLSCCLIIIKVFGKPRRCCILRFSKLTHDVCFFCWGRSSACRGVNPGQLISHLIINSMCEYIISLPKVSGIFRLICKILVNKHTWFVIIIHYYNQYTMNIKWSLHYKCV